MSLPRSLSPELVLKRAGTAKELDAVLACHAASFGEEDCAGLRAHLLQRPGQSPGKVVYVQQVKTGVVASSLSLMRLTWTYEGIPFEVAEAGIVSTREEYRKRGLVREQFEVYHRLALQAGCLVSIIEGIPHFYRQFGYEYVLPMGGGLELRPDQVPDLAEGESSPYQVRLATAQDMPILQGFYAESVKDLCVASVLSEEVWEYQDSLPEGCADRKATYLVQRDGELVGYLRMTGGEDSDWNKGVRIVGASLPHQDACMAALRFAKRVALQERKEHRIRIELPHDVPLVQAAADLGGQPKGPYAWLVRVLDPVRFLLTIAPALERRLARSPMAGLSQDFAMNLYKEVIVLRLRKGRLLNVAAVPRAPVRHLQCPPTVIPTIWFGYRSVAEVMDWYADAACKDKASQRVAEVLFPKRDSWVCSLF